MKAVPIVLGSSIISLLMSLASIMIMVYMRSRQNFKETQVDYDDGVCLECSRLPPQEGELDRMFKTLNKRSLEGKEMCCADTPDQMTSLVELLIAKTKSGPNEPLLTYEPQNFTHSGASAHKRLHPSTIFRDGVPRFSENENCPLLFDPATHDGLTEHVRDVEVLTSGYHILVTGLYYVYSNLHFRPDSSRPCKDYTFQTWESVVVRSRPNDRQNSGPVLRSLHTCCDNCTRDKETSYAGGVFYLQANDHLHMEVSGAGLISFQKQTSFFGLAMQGRRPDSVVPLQGQVLDVEKGLSSLEG